MLVGTRFRFATKHLGYATLTNQLLPYLLNTAEMSDIDSRVVITTSEGYELHRLIEGGIAFDEL